MGELRTWVVDKIVLLGKHGPYAVAKDPLLGSVTFSLLPGKGIWREDHLPEEGSEVILENFEKKRYGWRAMKARFVRPQDLVNPSTSNVDQQRARSREQ